MQKTKELTAREREVLRDIAQGLSTREIAERYGVTAGTIATHRHNILRKAECKTSAAAVMKLMAPGNAPIHSYGSL